MSYDLPVIIMALEAAKMSTTRGFKPEGWSTVRSSFND